MVAGLRMGGLPHACFLLCLNTSFIVVERFGLFSGKADRDDIGHAYSAR